MGISDPYGATIAPMGSEKTVLGIIGTHPDGR
ncbi:MAG: hypothetical protein ACI9BK_002418, partial [Acidimicrobiales bacterium]